MHSHVPFPFLSTLYTLWHLKKRRKFEKALQDKFKIYFRQIKDMEGLGSGSSGNPPSCLRALIRNTNEYQNNFVMFYPIFNHKHYICYLKAKMNPSIIEILPEINYSAVFKKILCILWSFQLPTLTFSFLSIERRCFPQFTISKNLWLMIALKCLGSWIVIIIYFRVYKEWNKKWTLLCLGIGLN